MPARELNRSRGGPAATRGADATKEAVDTLNRYATDFATVLPSHLNAQQWLRLAAGMLRRSPGLATTALQNPASFFAALMDCARLGLNPGDTYHLVPIGGEVVGITDWTGEIELIYRAGMVRKIVCQVVYEGADLENFAYEPGIDDRPRHRIDWTDTDRTKHPLALVYAYAEFKDGGFSDVVVMNRHDVDRVKAVSKTAKSSSSPWQQWEDRMWRKSAVKQLSKWVPSSAEFRVEQIRAETAVQQSRFGAVEPSRDYVELPAGGIPIDARGAAVNTATGEIAPDARFVNGTGEAVDLADDGPPADVQDPPDDGYDPTTDPNFGSPS